MKNKEQCIMCDKYLRTKKNDFHNRLTCYECYGYYRYSTSTLKRLYPKKSFISMHKNDVVNFGKFKNKTYQQLTLEKSYCNWLLSVWNREDNNLIKYLKYIYN